MQGTAIKKEFQSTGFRFLTQKLFLFKDLNATVRRCLIFKINLMCQKILRIFPIMDIKCVNSNTEL